MPCSSWETSTRSLRLILQLLELMNGIRADHLDSVRDEYCRLVRPKSKSRRILRDDIRAVEPFCNSARQREMEDSRVHGCGADE